MSEDMIEIRDAARQHLIAADIPPLHGAAEEQDGRMLAFIAGHGESQRPEWDNCRLLLIMCIDPVADDDIPDHILANEFPPHWHRFDLVPVSSTGQMMAPIVPRIGSKVGKVRDADVGRAYMLGWAYGKWRINSGKA